LIIIDYSAAGSWNYQGQSIYSPAVSGQFRIDYQDARYIYFSNPSVARCQTISFNADASKLYSAFNVPSANNCPAQATLQCGAAGATSVLELTKTGYPNQQGCYPTITQCNAKGTPCAYYNVACYLDSRKNQFCC
jgi:hypothetical protein